MSEGLKALFDALYQIGNQDIYTDAWEYHGRVGAMSALLGLLGRSMKGERITTRKIAEAVTLAGMNKPVRIRYASFKFGAE